MTILELRAELLTRNTEESVAIAENLLALPPYFTAKTLHRVNAGLCARDSADDARSGTLRRMFYGNLTPEIS